MSVHHATAGSEAQLVSGDISPPLSRAAGQAAVIACDTETTGLDWRTARLCLVQAHAPGFGTEVVRLTDEPPSRLLQLLQDDRVGVVFHHAAFDLRFLGAAYGVTASAVRCTKIAAKLLYRDEPDRQKLAALTNEHLGLSLDKSQQTSDWSTGQLSNAQIAYAAHDVVHLPDLLAALTRRLQEKGLLELAEACWRHIPIRVELDLRGYPDVYTY